MRPVEILKAARELIADPERWTQGNYAVDKSRVPTGVLNGDACGFCAIGAIAKSAGIFGCEAEISEYANDLAIAAGLGRGYDIIDFNDNHTHPEVLALFDKAIASAEVSA